MKVFVTLLIPFVFNKSFQKCNYSNVFLLVFVLFSMPLLAETHYLFPSDIFDQTEIATIPMNTNGWQRQRYPHLLYASDLEPENLATRHKNKTMRFSFQNMNRRRYPNAQYASDFKPNNRSNRYKNNDRLTSFQKIREPLRFVPSPLSTLYRRNGIVVQSRTISEAVALPGFNHLSPNYNNLGLNDLFGHQYNDPTRLGLFPEPWNLID